MSENPQDKPGSVKQLPDTEPKAPEPGRRLFILKAAAVLGVAAAALGGSKEARAKDFGSGHQDPEGQHHVQDGEGRRRRKHGGGGGKKRRKHGGGGGQSDSH